MFSFYRALVALANRSLCVISEYSESKRRDFNLFLDLREELQKCVTNAIPVISVTAVIGSTEESAIDPLTEILAMREEFKMKVYVFCRETPPPPPSPV